MSYSTFSFHFCLYKASFTRFDLLKFEVKSRFNILLHTNKDINANVYQLSSYLWEYSKCFHLLFEGYLAPHTDLPTPDKGKSGDSCMKKILQKIVRFYFFPIKIKRTLFPL